MWYYKKYYKILNQTVRHYVLSVNLLGEEMIKIFCSNCGANLANESNFCPSCGKPILGDSMDGQGLMYMLIIKREKQWFAINPAITVKIDHQDTYKLKNDETINISLSQGNHEISFTCTIRNKVININMQQNVLLKVKFDRITGELKVMEGEK